MLWSIRDKYLGEVSLYHSKACRICKKDDINTVQVSQVYLKVFGLPIAKLSKDFFCVCPSCNSRQKYKEADGLVDSLRDIEKDLSNFRYYWGWIIILLILSLVFSFYYFAIKTN